MQYIDTYVHTNKYISHRTSSLCNVFATSIRRIASSRLGFPCPGLVSALAFDFLKANLVKVLSELSNKQPAWWKCGGFSGTPLTSCISKWMWNAHEESATINPPGEKSLQCLAGCAKCKESLQKLLFMNYVLILVSECGAWLWVWAYKWILIAFQLQAN